VKLCRFLLYIAWSWFLFQCTVYREAWFTFFIHCFVYCDTWFSFLFQCIAYTWFPWFVPSYHKGCRQGEVLLPLLCHQSSQDDHANTLVPRWGLQSRRQSLRPSSFPLQRHVDLAVSIHRWTGSFGNINNATHHNTLTTCSSSLGSINRFNVWFLWSCVQLYFIRAVMCLLRDFDWEL